MSNHIVEVEISGIHVGERSRKDLGDIEGLARNIEEVGLLQPIGVTPDHRLIFGDRRLRAYELLGRRTIPVRVIDLNVLLGQFSENFHRKEYTVSERVAIVEAMRTFRHGGDRRSDQVRKCDDDALTVDEAAKRAGLGGKDGYARARAVINKGVPELVEAMDLGKIAISKAVEIAKLPEEDQRESAKRGRKVAHRDPDDFYPTPPEVTRALLSMETFEGEIWEPACGNGAMSCVLQEAGYDVKSSDLIDRGYGDVENFLRCTNVSGNIVTNPPFDFADAFVRKALASTNRKVAMLLPLTFLEGPRRIEWLEKSPLKTVHVFSNRINFSRNGEEERKNGRFVFAWFIWEHGYKGSPQIKWISTNGIDCSPGKCQDRPLEKAKLLPISKARPVRLNSVTEGDCRELIPRLPDAAINFCLTSPPYAEQRKGKYPGVPEKAYPQFTVEWMAGLWDKLADNGSVMIIIDPHVKDGVMSDYVRRTEDALCDFGWVQHQTQMWHKRDRAPLGHKWWPRHCWESALWFGKSKKSFCDPWTCGQPSDRLSIECIRHSRWSPGGNKKESGIARVSDVIDVPVGGNEKGVDHPAMFPVELAEQLIKTFCPPVGTILDPFAGSGSTLIAAKKLGCDYYGFDVMPDFCEIARKRLAAITNDKEVSNAG